MSLPADLRATYDAAAPSYDAFVPGVTDEAPLHRALLGAFAELVAAGDLPRVLDAGCGTGRLLPLLRSAGLDPVAVDASAGMVDRARRTGSAAGVAAADLSSLPFPDGAFGGVLAWYSLIHTPADSLAETVGELARVLAPGGHLLAGFQAGRGERTATGAYLGERTITAHLFTVEQVAEACESVGLATVATCQLARGTGTYPQGVVLARRDG